MMPEFALVVLAAGESRRLGTPKQLVRSGGHTLLEHVLRQARGFSATARLLVLGAYAEEIRSEIRSTLLEEMPWQILHNPRWKEGMSTSIHRAVHYLREHHPAISGALFMVGDQPFMHTHVLQNIFSEVEKGWKGIVASRYAGTLGTPVWMPASRFGDLLTLEGDKGARKLLQQFPDEVKAVEFEHGEIDIDTPGDVERWRAMELVDNFQRVHDYLRISLTDNCNLRCTYCMPEEEYIFTPASQLMQADEMVRLASTFVSLGVRKIRLTGGEPLVRKDAADIIRKLSELPVSLSLTTNATRIHDFIDVLKESGVRSINVSLDTLQADKFQLLTRRDQFPRVMDNIRLLLDHQFRVKINVVVLKGLNDMEIPAFVEWTRSSPLEIRFIEFMPFQGNRWDSSRVFTLQDMLTRIREQYEVEPLPHMKHETAKKFRVPGFIGNFAVISTMSAPFCSDCNRLRLTADGKLKNCLFSSDETDLLSALRQGQPVIPLIKENLRKKAWGLGGQLRRDFEHLHPEEIRNRSMITIGG